MMTINQALFLSWVVQVFGGDWKRAVRELKYSPKYLVAVARGSSSISKKLAFRIKRASERLTPQNVLTLDQLFDPGSPNE